MLRRGAQMSFKFDLMGNGEVHPDLLTLTIGGISSIAYMSPDFNVEMFDGNGQQLQLIDMKRLKNQQVFVIYLKPGDGPVEWGNNPSNDIRDCAVLAELPDGSRYPVVKNKPGYTFQSKAVSVRMCQ